MNPLNRPAGRMVVVSNRLPFVVEKDERQGWRLVPGSGGLVSALLPTLKDRGGVWIGWPGAVQEEAAARRVLSRSQGQSGYRLVPVMLSADDIEKFYLGFSNEIIWPLFHDLQSMCNFDPGYWQSYVAVNRKYAAAVRGAARPADFVWVHDYHLMLLGRELRRLRLRNRMAFFLHIPFPPPDIFFKLPWRQELVYALLEFDLVGFQTWRDRHNFLQCLEVLAPQAAFSGRSQVMSIRLGGRTVRLGHFPISVDFAALEHAAGQESVLWEVERLQEALHHRQLILGLDRLDYTKGILYRLQAFQYALEHNPSLQDRVTLVQVVVPSRGDIPRYHELRLRIEQTVSRINGQYTRPGSWVPIHYLYRNLSPTELAAFYRAAGIALVTPLKDGMNLVAKEYCACSLEEDCVLILSEFAGAAAQLHHWALTVNPYDVKGVADAIARACRMDWAERHRRMRPMRRSIRRHDIFWWLDLFLHAAFRRDLDDFPVDAKSLREGAGTLQERRRRR